MMPSAWAQSLYELLFWRKLRDCQTCFAFAFELHHDGGDGLIIENGQDHFSSDEVQVSEVGMRAVKLNVYRHGSLGERLGGRIYDWYTR